METVKREGGGEDGDCKERGRRGGREYIHSRARFTVCRIALSRRAAKKETDSILAMWQSSKV